MFLKDKKQDTLDEALIEMIKNIKVLSVGGKINNMEDYRQYLQKNHKEVWHTVLFGSEDARKICKSCIELYKMEKADI